MLAMCCMIMFSALENAAPSAKRIVIMGLPRQSGAPRAGACGHSGLLRTGRSGRRLHLVLVLPPARRAHLLGVGAQRRVLTEILRRGADAIGDRAQGVRVEVVAAGGRLPQQL